MQGMSRLTGKRLSDIDHLRQSILDILTTPLGSRVLRRDYGSRLYELVDAPTNPRTFVELYAATAQALARWEPRIHVTRVRVVDVSMGNIQLAIEGDYLPRTPNSTFIRLDNIVV